MAQRRMNHQLGRYEATTATEEAERCCSLPRMKPLLLRLPLQSRGRAVLKDYLIFTQRDSAAIPSSAFACVVEADLITCNLPLTGILNVISDSGNRPGRIQILLVIRPILDAHHCVSDEHRSDLVAGQCSGEGCRRRGNDRCRE